MEFKEVVSFCWWGDCDWNTKQQNKSTVNIGNVRIEFTRSVDGGQVGTPVSLSGRGGITEHAMIYTMPIMNYVACR